MPQLTCRDVILGYEGKTVISGLTFSVNSGDYLCIVGENGSGKSTLMRAILKLKALESGSIITGNDFLPDEIGYLPQQTTIQKDFPASVREVVRSGCLNRRGLRPLYNKREKQMAEENMRKLGIVALAKRCYRELSGGQQQRALLARALCAARKTLLLDEPVAGLDPKAASDMYAVIKKMNEDGVTIIMISHDIAASTKFATHILHIGTQSVLFFGTTAEYMDSEPGKIYTGSDGKRE